LADWPVDPDEQSIFFATQNRIIKIYRASGEDDLQVAQHFLPEDARVTALVSSPNYWQDGTLIAGTTAGLMASTARGEEWQPMAGPSDDRPVVGLTWSGERLYAMTLGGNLWQAEARE
jgi:hypothetical protein